MFYIAVKKGLNIRTVRTTITSANIVTKTVKTTKAVTNGNSNNADLIGTIENLTKIVVNLQSQIAELNRLNASLRNDVLPNINERLTALENVPIIDEAIDWDFGKTEVSKPLPLSLVKAPKAKVKANPFKAIIGDVPRHRVPSAFASSIDTVSADAPIDYEATMSLAVANIVKNVKGSKYNVNIVPKCEYDLRGFLDRGINQAIKRYCKESGVSLVDASNDLIARFEAANNVKASDLW